jgi:hypothetical protein
MVIIITDDEHRQQVEDFISYRHRIERKPNTPSKHDKNAWPLRVKIDTMTSELAESSAKSPGRIERMGDDEFAAEMMGG